MRFEALISIQSPATDPTLQLVKWMCLRYWFSLYKTFAATWTKIYECTYAYRFDSTLPCCVMRRWTLHFKQREVATVACINSLIPPSPGILILSFEFEFELFYNINMLENTYALSLLLSPWVFWLLNTLMYTDIEWRKSNFKSPCLSNFFWHCENVFVCFSDILTQFGCVFSLQEELPVSSCLGTGHLLQGGVGRSFSTHYRIKNCGPPRLFVTFLNGPPSMIVFFYMTPPHPLIKKNLTKNTLNRDV